MNAQEAIERMEKRLDKLKEKITLFEGQSYRLEHKRLIDEVKDLSIVLESAKYLHEELIDQNLIKNEDSFRVLCLLTDLGEYKEITYDQARAIGLEEGADE